MPISLLRLPEVKARTGLSRSTIYLKMSLGEFPKQIQLSKRCVGWSSEAIDDWITDQLTRADALPLKQSA